MEIPKKCKKCMHRLKAYCKGHQSDIDILSVENCMRSKIEKRRDKKRRKKKNER